MTTSINIAEEVISDLVQEKSHLARPFLKWAGGKYSLLKQLSTHFPLTFNEYYEPFLGGGAVFFHIANTYPEKYSYLNDINVHLINSYEAVRDRSDDIEEALTILINTYNSLDTALRKSAYNDLRAEYNNLPAGNFVKSVLLIFLNRACYNGMYRENSKGQYNIPVGRSIISGIQFDALTIRKSSSLLSNTLLSHLPFEHALDGAKSGDFVYLDPPYYPASKTSNFTKYTEYDFLDEEQFKLKHIFDDLSLRGCKVLMSNSNTEFIKNLYQEYDIDIVKTNRRLSGKASGRTSVNEVVIKNYKR